MNSKSMTKRAEEEVRQAVFCHACSIGSSSSPNGMLNSVTNHSSCVNLTCLQARNEVRLLAGLKHPNVVRYFESFVDSRDGRLLIVMELCEVYQNPMPCLACCSLLTVRGCLALDLPEQSWP